MASDRLQDCVHWYMSDLAARVVADSGIPTDRYHLGKLILQALKDYPDAVMQIDGATGESITNQEILKMSTTCANSYKNMGLEVGDVVVIMSPSNLHMSVPFYAALFTGMIIAPIDCTLGVMEIVNTFSIIQPKLIFCHGKSAPNVQLALNEMESNATIVTFDKEHYLCSITDFLDKFSGGSSVEDFKATDFDASDAAALLISTSGTTGLPKAAETTHKNFAISVSYQWSQYQRFPSPVHMALVGAPLQWLTSIYQYISTPIFKIIRLESSAPLSLELACEIINKYKPSYTIFSPTLMTSLVRTQDKCDLTCFRQISLGGSAVNEDLLTRLQKATPETFVYNAFGMTELCGLGFHGIRNNTGLVPLGCFQYRIINPETLKDIVEPNIPGELWMKGPNIFKGYYKNESATREAFAEDGWFKTGDMFVRNEQWNYTFVERIKLLLKYKSFQISPVELENVIRRHPAVLDVAVTGLKDDECGELPVACVVLRPGYNNVADQIKQLVKDSLSDAKQLRGGVVFLDAIPVTATTKVHRRKLKELVQTMERH